MKELSLFTGAGGGILGSKLLEWTTVGYVEWEPYCQKVIRQRIKDGIFDNAPIFGDIRVFNSEGYAESYKGMVDIVTGGFPCQPFSVAGKQLGADDLRNMWPETIRTIRTIRPRFTFLENVPGLLSSEQSSVTFTRWGTMYDGVCYQLENWEPHTKEIGCGYLPTPNAGDGKRGPTKEYNPKAKSQSGRSLSTYAARMFPTPTAHMAKETNAPSEANRNEPTLSSIVGGQLNPMWVEWLMGWPIGHTDLKPLETDKFRSQWLRPFKSYLKGLFKC